MRKSLKENQPEGHPDDQHGEYLRQDSHETTGPLREMMRTYSRHNRHAVMGPNIQQTARTAYTSTSM